ncbi:MAG: hypothetical protein ABR569_02595 [Gaiellaceae bacterium]
MKRLAAWLSGALGGLAVYRLVRRRRGPAVELPAAGPDPRAGELRAKLEESRALLDERDAFEAGETAVDEADSTADPDERRRRVHEQARSAVDEMRRSGAD